MTNEICYKKNFLKQVIAKIDFAQPLADLTPDSVALAVKGIRKRFPISEQGTAVQQGIEISGEAIKSSKTEFPEWVFHGAERNKSLKINQQMLYVLLTKYQTEGDFRDDVVEPIKNIVEAHTQPLISRTGVRFINVFDFEIATFEQAREYFVKGIAGHLAYITQTEQCSRSFLVNEYQIEDIKLKVQSGFFNPDYPAILKRRHFVLDIDAYIDFPHEIKDVASYFKQFHELIQKTFESHITQKLRDEVLNA